MREIGDPALDRLDAKRALAGAEIERMMNGATLLCRTVYGDPYSVEVRPDGTLIG